MLLLCVCVLFLSILLQCDNPYDTRWRPERLLLYDKHPGGIGLVAQVGRRPGGGAAWEGGSEEEEDQAWSSRQDCDLRRQGRGCVVQGVMCMG